jgi:hypothetical protein
VAYRYLALAVIIVMTLTKGNRLLRSMGTAIVAAGLAMIAPSIVLASFDGSFAGHATRATGLAAWSPTMVNIHAAFGFVALAVLLWHLWAQFLSDHSGHIGAVAKHHFRGRRPDDLRRIIA